MLAFDAATATNQFGLDLYRQVASRQAGGNLVLSPYSISEALTMVEAGADGATREELVRTLHHSAKETEVLKSFATLRRWLGDSAQKTVDSLPRRRQCRDNAGVVEWRIANRLFGQTGDVFRQDYLERLAGSFGNSVAFLDFRAEPEAARMFINNWVTEQTRDKIHDLIPPLGLSEESRLVLANALYFKAQWAVLFEKDQTQFASFALTPTETALVPMMGQTGYFSYSHEHQLTTVALACEGHEFQLLIFLPDHNHDLKTAAAGISADSLRRCTQRSEPTYLNLHLPRYKVSGRSLRLKRGLCALGLSTAFNEPLGSADFRRIAPRTADDYLALGEVHHQTFLAVDEDGIEATAATCIGAYAAGLPPKPIEVRVDRPFLFAIQHIPTSVCLFFGHIGDPR